MARLLQEPKEEHLEYLRELIINTFSKPIVNSNDCKLLEDAIQEEINQRLSVDTLARLFGIKKSASSPSIFTLDTCSNYVGYASWKDLVTSYLDQSQLYQKALLFEIMEQPISFDELVTRLNVYSKSIALFETFRQIMLFKAQQKDEAFFERLFEIELLFEFQENYKYAIYNTVHLLSILCHKHEWLSKIAIQHYANVSYTLNYFVEWVVVPERAYYLPLLDRYCYYKPELD
jgi:chemotaxis protein CheY-P-specific phosphatase CheC